METTTDRARLAAIKIELDALYFELKHRSPGVIEQRITETATELIDVPGLPRFPFESLICFRMTDADRRRETKLIDEWKSIAARINTAVAQRRQAKINAREIAQVRSAACPICFATHAGECA